MHPNVHSSITYNSQDMEATYMSINRLIDNEDIIYIYTHTHTHAHTHTRTHIHTMEYYSAIKNNEICHLQKHQWPWWILCLVK